MDLQKIEEAAKGDPKDVETKAAQSELLSHAAHGRRESLRFRLEPPGDREGADVTPLEIHKASPILVRSAGGTMHNVAAMFHDPPPDTRDNDPHAIEPRSPSDRVAGGRRLFDSPGADVPGSSAEHAKK